MREDVWSHFGNWWAVGLWSAAYAALLLFLPFYRKAQRKPAGTFLAFVVAYALEMFGIPLTLYGVLWATGRRLPEGILWGHSLVGRVGLAGTYACLACTAAGASLVVAGWRRIHREFWSAEEGRGRLVREGLYARIRHPQYAGFLLVAAGLLLEWANLFILVLFPVLCAAYYRLARREEAELAAAFGEEWASYAAGTGMFLPRLRGRAARAASLPGGARVAVIALAAAAALGFVPARASAEGFSWTSYAEAGLGASLSGGATRPLAALSSGIVLGPVELGTYADLLPFELGSPDLLRAGAVRWGGSFALRPELGLPVAPFARVGLGRIGTARSPVSGAGDLTDLSAAFDCRLSAGLELALGGRWAARAWGGWNFAPGFEDFDGRSLAGAEAGLSIRATWETRLR